MSKIYRWIGWVLGCMTVAITSQAQEQTAPLRWNGALDAQYRPAAATARKGTALSLPFFEDFTDASPYPNAARWADSNVYLNNTMCVGAFSRGVATFDALNKRGRPYDTVNRQANDYADSLTSLPFDLSAYTPGDNIYLSFFYQPQGAGFSPDPGDSLYLFFHPQTGPWTRMWSQGGTTLQPFRQVMIPVTDPAFLYNGFEFRFVNRASINTNDDIWNIDYIRMGVNRGPNDTAVTDLAFTTVPTFLLNDYTAMPYRQYIANAAGERAATISDSLRNNYPTNATVNYGYTARELTTATPLSNATGTVNVTPYTGRQISFPSFTATPAAPGPSSRMVFETKYYLQSGNPNEPKANDTNIHQQVFDNYLAYDDGSAEKSYFLNQFSTLPAKTAIEFRLNQPDTLRGIAIYFGQQVPTAVFKPISLVAYKTLAGIAGATKDSVIALLENYFPVYTDSINKFTVYRFDNPVLMSSGPFYVGYIQPANSGSDSLYIGLDVNRVGSNHLYYNVLNTWQSSNISGALLVRPLLGGVISGTGVKDLYTQQIRWDVYPNPAVQTITITLEKGTKATEVSITDIAGREIIHTALTSYPLDVANLQPGIYFIRIRQQGYWSPAKKIIKQ